MQYSVVMTTPVASAGASNAIAENLGYYGSSNFSVPLYSGETLAAYGLHTYAVQEFVDTLTAAQGGTMPVVEGMTPEQVEAAISQWVVSVQPIDVDAPAHFDNAVLPLVRSVDG